MVTLIGEWHGLGVHGGELHEVANWPFVLMRFAMVVCIAVDF